MEQEGRELIFTACILFTKIIKSGQSNLVESREMTTTS